MNCLQRRGARWGLLALLMLTGCSDGDPPDPSSATPDSGSPSSSESESSGATSAPSASPATGEAIVDDSAFVRVPEGYRVDEFGFGIWNASPRRGRPMVTFADFGAVAVTTLKQLTKTGLTNFKGRPTVTYDADLGGEPAYMAVGRNGSGPYVEYGAVHGGNAVVVAFAFRGGTPKDEQDALIASVLASFSWSA